ncbi:aarF domain-containing protein kinase 1 isoform X1 [Pseudoliparis swirei]|uniref:aarF domain-containing protein kinase 1 isoform X1 n=1 Tax=Pseudoliparis swirei TaxID=2059687 RepID=UPI0024BDE7A5|nr:aarF domain-containing protein kinase 1 isoform X1 [Pseudoliparis swirei]
MAGNLLKVSSLAAAVFASSGFYLYNRPLNLNDLSVIRFGRAAATTVVISLDYLTAFKHVEHDTEEYWALRSKLPMMGCSLLQPLGGDISPIDDTSSHDITFPPPLV